MQKILMYQSRHQFVRIWNPDFFWHGHPRNLGIACFPEACKTHRQQKPPSAVFRTQSTSPDKHFADWLLICLSGAFAKNHKRNSCEPASFPKHHKISNIF